MDTECKVCGKVTKDGYPCERCKGCYELEESRVRYHTDRQVMMVYYSGYITYQDYLTPAEDEDTYDDIAEIFEKWAREGVYEEPDLMGVVRCRGYTPCEPNVFWRMS